jgi:hypothetical protein
MAAFSSIFQTKCLTFAVLPFKNISSTFNQSSALFVESFSERKNVPRKVTTTLKN